MDNLFDETGENSDITKIGNGKKQKLQPSQLSPVNISTDIGYLKKNGKNWDKPITINLRDYAYNSYALSWMTGHDAQLKFELSRKITFTAVILSSVIALVIASILPIVEKTDIKWISYILIGIGIVLSLISAILNGYKLTYNLDYTYAEHLEKSAKFGKLFRSIKNQFHLPKESRYDGKTFLEFVSDRFDELSREKLFISTETQEEWDKFQVPRNENGELDYNKILLLPCELRVNEENETNDYVTIDIPVTAITSRKIKELHRGKKVKNDK